MRSRGCSETTAPAPTSARSRAGTDVLLTEADRSSLHAGQPGVEGETRTVLERCAARLAETRAPPDAVERLRALLRQIGQPCVVAVVGQVNAGKSTFINALLGDDKAIVGSTETTATINHFVYGQPSPGRPVRCYWRAGHITEETSDFLASLQGHDREALERAHGIDRLEYLVPSALLRTITYVDTPGTGAVIAEHESRTGEFLDLAQRLRERHDAETVRIQEGADAVIYLVGAVAQASDAELLDQFVASGDGHGRAMNTLGVIAKVDLSAEMIERRHELAGKVAGQLEAQLNAVVPVSAGLARAIDRLGREGLDALADVLRRIPGDQLDLLLSNQQLFVDYEPDGCPVPSADRRRLYDSAHCDWRVFAVIAGTIRALGELDEVEARLHDLAGFKLLRRTLEEHFLVRSQMLRCYRIAQDARRVLKDLWFGHVASLRRGLRVEQARLERFIGFVDEAPGDAAVALELRSYLSAKLDRSKQLAQLEDVWKAIDADLAALLRRLSEFSADFAALHELDGAASAFSREETEELRALLGRYGADTQRRLRGDATLEDCVERQVRWRLARDQAARGGARRRVADRAHARLGLIIDELVSE